MSGELPESVELIAGGEPDTPAQAAVIWLHGLGADGNDFVPVVTEQGLAPGRPVRFVFPHAPQRPITVNGGYVMRGWYDIVSPRLDEAVDESGIAASVALLHRLIEREVARGLPAARIVVAGFSQGGVIALQGGLGFADKLGGILALSTYLPLSGLLTQPAALPVFMAHGRQDPIVPYELGRAACDWLLAHESAVEWHSYAMGHSVCGEEIAAIGEWLNRVFS